HCRARAVRCRRVFRTEGRRQLLSSLLPTWPVARLRQTKAVCAPPSRKRGGPSKVGRPCDRLWGAQLRCDVSHESLARLPATETYEILDPNLGPSSAVA